jgi:hypothetical protein
MTSFDEPTKPEWPLNVFVFYPHDNVDDIKNTIKQTEDNVTEYGNNRTYNANTHFSTKHFALLFAPGQYKNCDFEIGYYVQMVGLGRKPEDVEFITENGYGKSGPFVEALRKNDVHVPFVSIFNKCDSLYCHFTYLIFITYLHITSILHTHNFH